MHDAPSLDGFWRELLSEEHLLSLKALRETIRQTALIRERQAIFDRIVIFARDAIGCDHFLLLLNASDDTDHLIVEAMASKIGGSDRFPVVRIDGGRPPQLDIHRFFAASTEITLFEEQQLSKLKEGHLYRGYPWIESVATAIVGPIVFREQTIGCVLATQKNAPSMRVSPQYAKLLIELIISEVSYAMERIESLDYGVHRRLRKDTIATFFQQLLTTAAKVFEVDAGIAYIFEPSSARLRSLAIIGYEQEHSVPPSFSYHINELAIATHCLKSDSAFFYENAWQCEVINPRGRELFKIKGPIFSSPIRAGGEVVGCLVLWTKDGRPDIKEGDEVRLRALTDLAGAALEREFSASAVLEQQEEMLTGLKAALFKKDLSGVFLWCNEAFVEHLPGQWTVNTVVGVTDAELYPPEKFPGLAKKYMEDDHAVFNGEVILDIEQNVDRKGKSIVVIVLKQPLRNRLGAIVGIRGVYLKLDEETLSDLSYAVSVLTQMEESALIGHWTYRSARGTIAEILKGSPQFWRNLGLESGVRGVNAFLERVTPSDQHRIEELIRNRGAGSALSERFCILLENGDIRTLLIEIRNAPTPIGGSTNPIANPESLRNESYLYGTLQDISDNLQREEAGIIEEELGFYQQWSSGLAHDTLMFLQHIGNALEYVPRRMGKCGYGDGKTLAKLREAMESLISVRNIIKDGLGANTAPGKCAVNELVHEVCRSVLPRIKKAGLTLELTELAESLPEFIILRTRVERALRNVLSNAIEHSERGAKIVVRTRLEVAGALAGEAQNENAQRKLGQWPNIVIEVEDFGSGIMQEFEDRIFTAGESTKKEHGKEHYGIGLTLVRRYMLAHAGAVIVKDKLRRRQGRGVVAQLRFAAIK